MITIYLNEEKIILTQSTSLDELLKNHVSTNKNFAIAINRQFIPRVKYQLTQLHDGDQIDIVTPMQGG